MQWCGKHAATTIKLLLESVFSTRSAQRSYNEDNSGDLVSWESACEENTRGMTWYGHQPGSYQLRVQFCTRGREEKS
jgi:hypothetical protein